MSHMHSSHEPLKKTFEKWKDHIDFIPGDQKRRYAKLAYNITKQTVCLVQSAIYLPLQTLKGVSALIAIANSILGRVFFKATQIPTFAKKHFFPSPEQILEKRMEDLEFKLKHHNNKPIILKDEKGRKLSHEENRGLMNQWIHQHLSSEEEEQNLRLCFLMNEIADGDLSSAVLDKYKDEAKTIASHLSNKVRGINSFITTFIDGFADEGKIIISPLMDPHTLLRFPNLLKTKEAEMIIENLQRGSLKSQLQQKLLEVTKRSMTKRHNEESRILNELSEQLHPMNLEEIKERHLSNAEEAYLKSRLEKIEEDIAAHSRAAKRKESFEIDQLNLEKDCLKKQWQEMLSAKEAILDIESHDKVTQANQVNGRFLQELDKIFKEQLRKKKNFLNTIHPIDNECFQDLEATFSKLTCPNPGEPIENYFKEIKSLYKNLQKIESDRLKKIPRKSTHIEDCNEAQASLQAERSALEELHKTTPWETLQSILPCKKRKEKRQEELATHLICWSLEMREEGDCLLPLKLAKKDSASDKTKPIASPVSLPSSLSRIEKSSKSFIAAVIQQNLKQFVRELDSLEERIATVENGEPHAILNPLKQKAINETRLDVSLLYKNIHPHSELVQWGNELQKIWLDNMPQDDRVAILKAPQKNRDELMKQRFDSWLEKQTGDKFPFTLSFKGLVITDLSEDRAAACKTLGKKFKKSTKSTVAQTTTSSSGFKTQLIEKFEHEQQVTPCNLLQLPYTKSYGEIQQSNSDIIKLLADTIEAIHQQYDVPIKQADDLGDAQRVEKLRGEKRVEIVKVKAQDPRFDGIQNKNLDIRHSCLEIALHFSAAVTPELIEIFLNTYRDASGQLKLEPIENSTRECFLYIYLHMIGALIKNQTLYMNEKERRLLVQMCQLSPMSISSKNNFIASFNLNKNAAPGIPFAIEIGEALQKSSITLEGIEESVLEHSFQEMKKNNFEQRELLDKLRNRSGSKDGLLTALFEEGLLKEFEKNDFSLDKIEEREAFSRAFLHAATYASSTFKDKVVEKCRYLIPKDPLVVFDDESTMKPSMDFFLWDLILKIKSPRFELKQNIKNEINKKYKNINEKLIASNDAYKMLVGYAQEITRISNYNLQKNAISDEDLARLIKCKIGYQTLKQAHFNDKRALSGFVEMAVMSAETAIINSMDCFAKKMREPSTLDNLLTHFKKPLLSSNQPSHADVNWIEKFDRINQGLAFSKCFGVHYGMIRFGHRLYIDTITGNCYINGEQSVELSPEFLQNDPTLRLLGLNSLPYIKDSVGDFCYVTEEKGVKVAQVKVICQPAESKVIIQKRLPVSFNNRTPELLQYIPREEINFPFVIEHRLQAKHFWQSENGDILAFDTEGELVTIIKTKETRSEIFTREQDDPFIFISDQDMASRFVPLNYLLACFSPNDILFDPKNNIYWVPGADLKLTLTSDKTAWSCSGKDVSNLVLDTDEPPSTYIPLKQNEQAKKAADIKNHIRVYKERLTEAKKKNPSPSHIAKDDISSLEKKIADLEIKLSEVLGKVCFATLAEKAFMKDKASECLGEDIKRELTNDFPEFKIQFDSYIDNEYLPVDVYQTILKDIKTKLKELQNELRSSANAREIQQRYLKLEKIYSTIEAAYEKDCTKMMERTLFHLSVNQSISSENLSAALILCLNALRTNQLEPISIPMMKEFSKYALTGPLSDSQYEFLSSILDTLNNEDLSQQTDLAQLRLYLSFMQHRHFALQVEQLSHMPLKNREIYVQAIFAKARESEERCKGLCQPIESPIESELLDMWTSSSLAQDRLDQIVKKAPTRPLKNSEASAVIQRELEILSRKNLLERLHATESITSKLKNIKNELSEEQEKLVKNFRLHSPKQVEGFYLEEVGRFNEGTLFAEFDVESDKSGLFGITKDDVQQIFKKLIEKKWINRESSDTHYSLASPLFAMDKFDRNVIIPVLIGKSYTEDEINKITDRLQTFLFRSMQSGYTFSFTNEQVLSKIEEQLYAEKEEHRQKYLEAESALQSAIEPYKLHITDLKYAFLSNDGSQLPEALQEKYDFIRNALARYLFHKTEVQHIENVEKAPRYGERNKIELLQTRRNYPINLIFKESATGDELEEQIMQKAFLVFEEDYGYRCNAMQIRMFRSLLRTPGHRESIDAAQARMGFGKTALLPLMAIVRVALERTTEDKHLVRYVVPKAVIEDNNSSFNEKLTKILGKNVIKDREFSRYQIDEAAKKDSLSLILNDLKNRLALYMRARDKGDVLIQWPEIRGSMEAQELDFAQLLIDGKMDNEEIKLCIDCKQTLATIRSLSTYTVFDELDETQDIKSREVNYTRGDKKPILKDSIQPLEEIVDCIERATHDFSDLQKSAKELLKAVHLECLEEDEKLIDYLTHRSTSIENLSEPLQESLRSNRGVYTAQQVASLFLIRAILLDPNMLSLAKSKQPNTHFGVRFTEREGKRVYFKDPDSSSALLIAVPYEGTNTPKGLSIFDNTEVAAITTLRYYASLETSLSQNPHLDFLLEQLKKGTLNDELSQHYLNNLVNAQNKSPLEKLKEMSELLDEEELKQAKENFFNDFMKEPDLRFRKFFAVAVVTTQIRSDAACTKSDRYEKGSQESIEKGCSGTVGGTSSYFEKQATDPAADGVLSLGIMGRSNNKDVLFLDPPKAQEDYLKQILTTLLSKAKPATRAIIDAAGICKSRDGTPESVVIQLWQHLKNHPQFNDVDGIIYYGKDGVKRLYKGSQHISCDTAKELEALKEEKKYFSFYGQKNTRGSDIKQADGAHALVTIDENVSNSDAKQAVLRFRKLVNKDSKQTFSFTAMPSFEGIIKKKLENEVDLHIDKATKSERLAKNKKNDALQQLQNTQDQSLIDEARKKILEADDEINASTNLCKRLRDTILPQIKNRKVEAKEVAQYLRLCERDAEEKNSLMIFRKEMAAQIKQAATHLEHAILLKIDLSQKNMQEAYIDFLKKRDAIVPFSVKTPESLFDKYGISSEDQSRDQFINEQTNQTNERIDALFNIAQEFSQHTLRQNIELNREFYSTHIERSAQFFKDRFGEETKIQIAAVDSDAQAIAEALAEAQAMAEAVSEALAENISVRVVQEPPAAVVPQLKMSEREFTREISLNFLSDRTLWTPIKDFGPMQYMVLKSKRNHFFVSPHLKHATPLVPHYIVKQQNSCIFISQEEADLLRKNQQSQPPNHENVLLFSTHSFKAISHPAIDLDAKEKEQITCVVLGDNGINRVELNTITTTQHLSQTALINVEPDQLLPHLYVKQTPNAQNYIHLKKFGLSKPTEIKIEFASQPNTTAELTFSSTQLDDPTLRNPFPLPPTSNTKISLDKSNKFVNEAMMDAFDPTVKREKRVQHAQELINNKQVELGQQKEALENEKRKVQLKQNEIASLAENVKAFEVTQSMSDGLRIRDKEKRNNYGDLFINALNNIEIHRMALISLLKGQPIETGDADKNQKIVQAINNAKLKALTSMANTAETIAINHINTVFKEFISDFVLTRAVEFQKDNNLKNDFLITREDWNASYRQGRQGSAFVEPSVITESWKPFDLVYGRIVHDVHNGNLEDAAGCGKRDCKEMFLTTLPNLIQAIKTLSPENLNQILFSILEVRKELKEITDRIDALEREMQLLPNAIQILKKLADDQSKVERNFKSIGIRLSESGELFDLFTFNQFYSDNWEDFKMTIQGQPPEYRAVVHNMKQTKEAFAALNREENDVFNNNLSFKECVNRLALQIEPRENQIHIS